ncbi:hypothetical protein Scep_006579 [Stephania cephalantha]|uniref:Uncharacterized protein n=1 Tax=Stephania cephalantha TaxID=152367 RepID=A0AAP0K8F2_9MAGN
MQWPIVCKIKQDALDLPRDTHFMRLEKYVVKGGGRRRYLLVLPRDSCCTNLENIKYLISTLSHLVKQKKTNKQHSGDDREEKEEEKKKKKKAGEKERETESLK